MNPLKDLVKGIHQAITSNDSLDELLLERKELLEENDDLRRQVETLTRRIAELEAGPVTEPAR